MKNKSVKKVSIVVPCYNVENYLSKCIEHLLHQTIGIENIEVILVDDASTDGGGTKKLIQKYEQCFPETIVAIFLEKNMRQGGARNVGVSYATGEYLTFCDADDWLLEEALEHAYDAAKEYRVDMVSFGRKNVNMRNAMVTLEKGNKSRLFKLDAVKKRKNFLLNMQEEDYGSQNKLFRLSLIKENHIRFVENLCMEEASFTLPVRLYANGCFYLDEQLYIYYISPGSTLRSGNWEGRKWDNLQVWINLLEEIGKRGLFDEYQLEIEYLFFSLGFGWSFSMMFQRGCILAKNEWKAIADMRQKLLPFVYENPYVKNEPHPFNRAWNEVLMTLLDMDFTDEDVEMANQAMMRCANAFSKCPAFC